MIFLFEIRRKPLGWVAGFCPFCRRPRPCELLAVVGRKHSPLLGQRPLPKRELRCGTCGVSWPTRVERYPHTVADPGTDFDALKAATDPQFDDFYADRLAVEAKLARGDLSSREREHLLREPFLYAEHLIARQESFPQPSPFVARAGRIGRWAAVGFIVAAVVYGATESDVALAITGVLCAVAVVAGFLVQFYGLLTARSWFRKRCVEPALLRALAPLRPDRAELEEVFDALRREKALAARVLRPARLHALLEESAWAS